MSLKEGLINDLEYRDGRLFWKVSRGGVKVGSRAGYKHSKMPYWNIRFKGRKYHEHQLVFAMFNGYIPKEIDHISDRITPEGIKSNKIKNLRSVTKRQNGQKRTDHKNKYGFRGLYKKSDGFWCRIRNFGVITSGGPFKTKKLAAEAYDRMAIKIHGEHAYTNFPKDNYQ